MSTHDPTLPDNDPLPRSSDENPSEQTQPKAKRELPVVSVPHDDDMIAQEMADLFEEDQVTHQHGSAEPEGD